MSSTQNFVLVIFGGLVFLLFIGTLTYGFHLKDQINQAQEMVIQKDKHEKEMADVNLEIKRIEFKTEAIRRGYEISYTENTRTTTEERK